jgi:SEC-C motif
MTLRDAFRRLIAGTETAPVPSLGRNDRCWCGSGRKYKICHQAVDDRRRSAALSTPRSAGRGSSARGF